MEGAKEGEKGLYVTLSETAKELHAAATSHGRTLDESVEAFEVVPPESVLDADQQQSLLYASDLELGKTTRSIFAAVERTRAKRIVLDSLSEIRPSSGIGVPNPTDLGRLKRRPACISGNSSQILRHIPVGTIVELAGRGTICPQV
jgi:hypothetical protein